MEATATAKFMRVSPRKARLVVDLIRGKKISEHGRLPPRTRPPPRP
jgi:ribosomal protein L22